MQVLLDLFRGEVERRRNRNRQTVEAIGLDVGSDDVGDISEVSRLVSLTNQVMEMKIKQGRYAPVDRTATLFRQHNQRTVERILGVGTRLDPTGKLPADVRETFDEGLRMVAAEVAAEGARLEKDFRAGSEQAGDSTAM